MGETMGPGQSEARKLVSSGCDPGIGLKRGFGGGDGGQDDEGEEGEEGEEGGLHRGSGGLAGLAEVGGGCEAGFYIARVVWIVLMRVSAMSQIAPWIAHCGTLASVRHLQTS